MKRNRREPLSYSFVSKLENRVMLANEDKIGPTRERVYLSLIVKQERLSYEVTMNDGVTHEFVSLEEAVKKYNELVGF